AEGMGANAIVSTRFVTSMVMSVAAELLAYGTAVVVE
ncbi:MAG: heavy metal-binding domain-containing protein, partial [Dehalococcoidia bacterium]